MQPNHDSSLRTWAMFCHLSALIWISLALVGLTLPFSNLLGPLVVWQLKKRESDFVDRHGRESLNFQISMTIYLLVLLFVAAVGILLFLTIAGGLAGQDQGAIAIVLGIMGGLGLALLLSIFGIFQLVVVIIATVQANNRSFFRYPLCLRFL
ncbi:MAG: DUF4870 domain-containing protein [Chloroflexaceae bacterium]|nr:DUF4870 domain-containing protein [Chloroflexaceae bacterium]